MYKILFIKYQSKDVYMTAFFVEFLFTLSWENGEINKAYLLPLQFISISISKLLCWIYFTVFAASVHFKAMAQIDFLLEEGAYILTWTWSFRGTARAVLDIRENIRKLIWNFRCLTIQIKWYCRIKMIYKYKNLLYKRNY